MTGHQSGDDMRPPMSWTVPYAPMPPSNPAWQAAYPVPELTPTGPDLQVPPNPRVHPDWLRRVLIVVRGALWGAIGGAACGGLFAALLTIFFPPLWIVSVPYGAFYGAPPGALCGTVGGLALAALPARRLRIDWTRVIAAGGSAAGSLLIEPVLLHQPFSWPVGLVIACAAPGFLLGPVVAFGRRPMRDRRRYLRDTRRYVEDQARARRSAGWR